MHLFWFLIDTAVVNAHILECESPDHLSIGLKKQNVYRTQKAFCHSYHSSLLICLLQEKQLAGQASVQMPAASPNMWLTYCQILCNVRFAVNQMPGRGQNLAVWSAMSTCVTIPVISNTTPNPKFTSYITYELRV